MRERRWPVVAFLGYIALILMAFTLPDWVGVVQGTVGGFFLGFRLSMLLGEQGLGNG